MATPCMAGYTSNVREMLVCAHVNTCAGVPSGSTAGTLCATYNDLDSVRAIFEANKGEISGVILEPVVGNSGYIPPTQEFLEGLRQMCTDEGAVLCFDEVRAVTRVARGLFRIAQCRGACPSPSACAPAVWPSCDTCGMRCRS
jgi:glutamate-1-semialdehyde aminotransferase